MTISKADLVTGVAAYYFIMNLPLVFFIYSIHGFDRLLPSGGEFGFSDRAYGWSIYFLIGNFYITGIAACWLVLFVMPGEYLVALDPAIEG